MRLMQSLAEEVAPYRIRVNAVSPGAIRTNSNRLAWEKPEAEAACSSPSPSVAWEVLRTWVAWSCGSPPTSRSTSPGATLSVDGGMSLAPGVREGG